MQGNLFSELPDIVPAGGKKNFTGAQLRDKGIEKAVKHAESIHENWKDRAYEFLLTYIKSHKRFMAEDVRIASARIVPEPPSLRSWGSIIRRAACSGHIKSLGTRKVKNPRAHCANSSFWEAV